MKSYSDPSDPCSGRAALRYPSDASYWIYLVHLPILFTLQYRLLDVNLPWGIKFAASVLATFGLCLLGCHAFVRSTRLGGLQGARAPTTMVQAGK